MVLLVLIQIIFSFRYYETLMMDPSEEVSPMMVISETLSKFVFHPLADAGQHLGLFFKNFYRKYK